jgi:hypothetical protein
MRLRSKYYDKCTVQCALFAGRLNTEWFPCIEMAFNATLLRSIFDETQQSRYLLS